MVRDGIIVAESVGYSWPMLIRVMSFWGARFYRIGFHVFPAFLGDGIHSSASEYESVDGKMHSFERIWTVPRGL